MGRKNHRMLPLFGIRFALLIATGDLYRLPVALRLIRPKRHPEYHTENALFRAMVLAFTPPVWAAPGVGEGDAAYGSQDNSKMVQPRDADEATQRWGFVFVMARTWKTVDDKTIKELVTHLPRQYSQRIRGPRLPGATGGKTFWGSK